MKDKKFRFDGRSRINERFVKENFNRIFNPTLTKNMPNVKWDATSTKEVDLTHKE